ncbi:MAG: phage holin family protein [Bacteroidales bacterium]|jgi:hypothetical protein|nr:phage holin family protein [Bacteroidales bacterium]
MEDNTRTFDELLDKATQYGKAELELAKLKAIDKGSEIVSATVPGILIFMLASFFMLFLNLGIAFWAGGLLGNLFFGFFAVAAFYGLIALILRLFMHEWLKRKVGDYVIRSVLK